MTQVAHTAYVVVNEDGTPNLVLEVNGGQETFELSPQAAGELRSAFIDGPQVRNDLEESQ